MKQEDLIYPNRFTELHNDETIFFCKRDFIFDEYIKLSKLNHNVILIVGNGDYSFDESLLQIKPDNVKHIFANNSLCHNEFITPLPVGIENITNSKREGHGIINQEIFGKLPFMLNDEIFKPSIDKIDKLYANFNVSTNLGFRTMVKDICLNSENIDFETGLTYSDFVSKIKSYLGTISPEGNGIECIRTFETLYIGEIPICVGDYSKYKSLYESVYKHLPIVYVDNPNDLSDHSKIKTEINKVKNNSTEMMYFDFWRDKIKMFEKKLL
jgi:hypothetical protein